MNRKYKILTAIVITLILFVSIFIFLRSKINKSQTNFLTQNNTDSTAWSSGAPKINLKKIVNKQEDIFLVTKNRLENEQQVFLPGDLLSLTYSKDFFTEFLNESTDTLYSLAAEKLGVNLQSQQIYSMSMHNGGFERTTSDQTKFVWGPFNIKNKQVVFILMQSPFEQLILSQWIDINNSGIYTLDTFIKVYPATTLWGDYLADLKDMSGGKFALTNIHYVGDEDYTETQYFSGIWDFNTKTLKTYNKDMVSITNIDDTWREYENMYLGISFKYPAKCGNIQISEGNGFLNGGPSLKDNCPFTYMYSNLENTDDEGECGLVYPIDETKANFTNENGVKMDYSIGIDKYNICLPGYNETLATFNLKRTFKVIEILGVTSDFDFKKVINSIKVF